MIECYDWKISRRGFILREIQFSKRRRWKKILVPLFLEMESVSKFRIFQNSFLFFSRRDDQQRKLDLIRNMIRNVIKTTLFKFPFLSFSMKKEFRNFEISNEFYYNHNIGILYKKKPGPIFVNPFQDSIGNWKFLNLSKFPNFSKRWRHYDTFDWIKDYRSRRDRKDSHSLGKRAFQFFVEGGGGDRYLAVEMNAQRWSRWNFA